MKAYTVFLVTAPEDGQTQQEAAYHYLAEDWFDAQEIAARLAADNSMIIDRVQEA